MLSDRLSLDGRLTTGHGQNKTVNKRKGDMGKKKVVVNSGKFVDYRTGKKGKKGKKVVAVGKVIKGKVEATKSLTYDIDNLVPESELMTKLFNVALRRVVEWNKIEKEVLNEKFLVTVQSSQMNKGKAGKTALGHFSAGRWGSAQEERKNDKGQVEVFMVDPINEVNFNADALTRTPDEIIGTVWHEAVHAAAHKAGIKDCAKSGRHNAKFAELATNAGLRVVESDDMNRKYDQTELSEELTDWLHNSEEALIDLGLDWVGECNATFTKKRMKLPTRVAGPRAKRERYECMCGKINNEPISKVYYPAGRVLLATCKVCEKDYMVASDPQDE
jgi:hypothetical protein